MTGSPKEQAKAAADLAIAVRSKALHEYGDAMRADPTTTDCKIALERFVLAFRAEHEAMCDVYRAMMADALKAGEWPAPEPRHPDSVAFDGGVVSIDIEP